MRLFLCGSTGNMNRGCEAIIRSTIKILDYQNGDIYLATYAVNQDMKMVKETGINIIGYNRYPTKIHRLIYASTRKIFKKSLVGYKYIEKPLFTRLTSNDICLTIGGDTYCYGRPLTNLALNKYTAKKGIKNILWCCSIEKESLTKEIINDLMTYEYIFVRESLSLNNLIEAGIPKKKLIKVCDPAFFLDKKPVDLPIGFVPNNTVGINVSELVIGSGNELVYKAVVKTIRYILDNTDMNVCLIPHVYNIEKNSNDYSILLKIYRELNNDRVSIVDKEYDCEQLKFIISKCRFFIGARTHATIAAYSCFVPTLVLGYSIKSIGIATDLFGTFEGFVIPYMNIKSVDYIQNSFIKIMENEQKIISKLKEVVPVYGRTLLDSIASFICLKEQKPNQKQKSYICDPYQCTGCMACVNRCPQKCIEIKESFDGFNYPNINNDKCINCGLCSNICPVKNKYKDDFSPIKYLFAKNKNKESLIGCSSGGVFEELAKTIIQDGGCVYGAAFDKNFLVEHMRAETKLDIEKLKKSKYVQSRINYIYKDVEKQLSNGKIVLFSGTPCQIGGLYSYLGKHYDTLFTVDIVCHGVPSPVVWQEYLKELKKQYNSEISDIIFRDKTTGWRNYSLTIRFVNGYIFTEPVSSNAFLRGFLSNVFLRNSCYECSFKQIHKQSDLTLGDFWGINKTNYNNDNKGASIVIINSLKGKSLVESIKNNVDLIEINREIAIRDNSAIFQSSSRNVFHDSFARTLRKKGYRKAYKKYCSKTLMSRIRRFLKNKIG